MPLTKQEKQLMWIFGLIAALILGMLAAINQYEKENAVLKEKISWYEKLYGPVKPAYVPAENESGS
jgi:hypothetical protein